MTSNFSHYFNTLQPLWQYLIDYNIATEKELILITKINGLNLETLQDVLYARTGYRTFNEHIETHTSHTTLELQDFSR